MINIVDTERSASSFLLDKNVRKNVGRLNVDLLF